jgi:hypothetical protein
MASPAFGGLPFERPQSFIAVWPGDDFIQPQYGGQIIVVPPRKTVAKQGPGSPYRFGAVKDPETGKPIPGTVLIESAAKHNPETLGYDVEFDAADWVRGVYQNNRPLLERGFTVVMSVGEIAPAIEAGRPKWEAAKKREWMSTLAEERRRQKRLEDKGEPYTESSNHQAVIDAIEGMRRLSEVEVQRRVGIEEIDAVLHVKSRPALVEQRAAAPEAAEAADDGEIDLQKVAHYLYQKAKAGNVALLKDECIGLLDVNEEVMRAVEAKLEAAGVAVDLAEA